MGYYELNFAGLNSGWYRNTIDSNYLSGRIILDKIWDLDCDDILEKFVNKYGIFYTVYLDLIAKEIQEIKGIDLHNDVRYYQYYIMNRTFEIDTLKNYLMNDELKHSNIKFECRICSRIENILDAHPCLILDYGIPPIYCMKCRSYFYQYKTIINEEFIKSIKYLYDNRQIVRKCDICSKSYSNSDVLDVNFNNYDGIYPNIFINLCHNCLIEAFDDNPKIDVEESLFNLFQIFQILNKIPIQDFKILPYTMKDALSLINFYKTMKMVRSINYYIEKYGSFLNTLINAKILPDGTRKMKFGIMSIANDGHICLSIPEKEIDDFLSKNNILHDKEVYYPKSELRADWEIYLGSQNRIFIEYFGLMQNKLYSEKSIKKQHIAKENGIYLLSIYPNDDWRFMIKELVHFYMPIKQND